jgi:tetratricopeptide (TPR) repeat protein
MRFLAHAHCRPLCLIFTSAFVSLCNGHGAYHDVVIEVTQALSISPNDAALHFKLACAHQEHGEWTSALVELEQVERLAPSKYETGFVQGQALATGGQWLAAKPVLDKFLITNPGHAGALAQRARVLLKLGQSNAAIEDFQAALAAAELPTADLFMETAEALIAANQNEQAIHAIRRGLERLGAEPTLLTRSLELELTAKHFDEALARVDALQKAAPRPEPWMARRAQVLADAGRAEQAKANWTALRDRLLAMPNLERGTPLLAQLLSQTLRALGEAAPAAVVAPPALSATPPQKP